MRRAATIALLTDFGTEDVYVGVMKAVIAQLAPTARLIDLTHEVRPGDVREGAFRLWQALPFLPPGCVVVAVVDPGVGTARKPIAVSAADLTFVCPDNGILTYALHGTRRIGGAGLADERIRAWEIRTPVKGALATSSTFHGRDVFAPAAALVARGVPAAGLGPEVSAVERLPPPRLDVDAGAATVRGEVVSVDRFGNLVTSIGTLRREGSSMLLEPWLPGYSPVSMPAHGLHARLGPHPAVALVSTFAEAAPGAPLAYIGSDGLLEIGVNRGSAVEVLRSSRGEGVELLRISR